MLINFVWQSIICQEHPLADHVFFCFLPYCSSSPIFFWTVLNTFIALFFSVSNHSTWKSLCDLDFKKNKLSRDKYLNFLLKRHGPPPSFFFFSRFWWPISCYRENIPARTLEILCILFQEPLLQVLRVAWTTNSYKIPSLRNFEKQCLCGLASLPLIS